MKIDESIIIELYTKAPLCAIIYTYILVHGCLLILLSLSRNNPSNVFLFKHICPFINDKYRVVQLTSYVELHNIIV